MRRNACLVVLPLAGGISLLLLAAALLLFLGLRPLLVKEKETVLPGAPLEIVKLTPTPMTTVTASPLPVPPVSCEVIISNGTVQVAASPPVSITAGGRSLRVATFNPDAGWSYPAGYTGVAAWACGTVVNYVIILEGNAENEALLSGLRPGDEIGMRLSSGTTLLFRFIERRETTAGDPRALEQVRPRVTLIMEKEGRWQVATADYVSEVEGAQPQAGIPAQPGQPVRIGEVQVTLLKGYPLQRQGDLPPGTMYYLIEFSLQNIGAASLDADTFNMQLQDSVGNVYLPSPQAAALGENGPLAGAIAPGTTVQGTVGYLVPETMAGPTLSWIFAPGPAAETWASVNIPYQPALTPSAPAQAEVTLNEDSTFLSSGGSLLVIGGEIRNVGGEPLTVEVDDIKLTSSAGIGELRSAAPPLPWVIEPGQSQIIELQYETPDAPTALLTLLGYSFEIRGLK
ncbi:MAG: DUF4352 domain-containing protein [Anaerolineae bacterium]|nr:DUF4352 domain-containing protein [Anaerolineae bacterium]